MEGGVIAELFDVAVEWLEARPYVLRPPAIGRVLVGIGREPAGADQALARLRGHVAGPADPVDDAMEVPAPRRLRARVLEDRQRNRVDLRADPLEEVGRAVDDRIEEADKH